ncbi:hypothetical protein KSS87_009855 [Heliosperma pusillum]|nr:hypothetical protein KSS87_009855 [Heliosperma pusillum]
MTKFGVLSFAMGCVSQASVVVTEQRPRRRKLDLQSPALRSREDDEDDDEESLSSESTRHSSRFLTLPRANLSTGVNKLVKGFKSLSQLFIYEDEMEELSMDIGCPTNVKHVAHIGWDNLASTNPFMKWDMDMDMDIDIQHSTPTPTPTLKHFGDASENDTSTFFTFNSSSTL